MTFLLLTGAGFSYNWGGPLAAEVLNTVLARISTNTLVVSCSIHVEHSKPCSPTLSFRPIPTTRSGMTLSSLP
jgi:hypothetical protein